MAQDWYVILMRQLIAELLLNWLGLSGMTGCAALLSESGLDGNCFHVIRLIDLNAWNPVSSLSSFRACFSKGNLFVGPE